MFQFCYSTFEVGVLLTELISIMLGCGDPVRILVFVVVLNRRVSRFIKTAPMLAIAWFTCVESCWAHAEVVSAGSLGVERAALLVLDSSIEESSASLLTSIFCCH